MRPALILRTETAKDRFGKRWKLNREVQTGDDATHAGWLGFEWVDTFRWAPTPTP